MADQNVLIWSVAGQNFSISVHSLDFQKLKKNGPPPTKLESWGPPGTNLEMFCLTGTNLENPALEIRYPS